MIKTSAKNRSWTPAEDALLLLRYPVEGTDGLVRDLDRSARAIQNRATLLKAQTPRIWSDEERAVVLEYYPVGGAKLVASRLSTTRTEKAIALIAKRLGIAAPLVPFTEPLGIRSGPTSTPTNRGAWSEPEDSLLRSVAKSLTLSRLHRAYFTGSPFTRTYAAVAQRLSALGLTAPRMPSVDKAKDLIELKPAFHLTAAMRDHIRSRVLSGARLADLLQDYPRVSPRLLRQQHEAFTEVADDKRHVEQAQRTVTEDESALRRELVHVASTVLTSLRLRDLQREIPKRTPTSLQGLTPQIASVFAFFRVLSAMRCGVGLRQEFEDAFRRRPTLHELFPEEVASLVLLAAAHRLGDPQAIRRVIDILPPRRRWAALVREAGLLSLFHLSPMAFGAYVRTLKNPEKSRVPWIIDSARLVQQPKMLARNHTRMVALLPPAILSGWVALGERERHYGGTDVIPCIETRVPPDIACSILSAATTLRDVELFNFGEGIRYGLQLHTGIDSAGRRESFQTVRHACSNSIAAPSPR
jgi:hypothetical protein